MSNINLPLRQLLNRVYHRQATDTRDAQEASWQRLVMLGRFAAHATIIGILIIAFVVARNKSTSSINKVAGQQFSDNGTTVSSPRLVSYGGVSHFDDRTTDGDVLIRQFVATAGNQPTGRRNEVLTYTVQAGDTTASIANEFGLQLSSLIWSNVALEDAPDRLSIGQQIRVPPADGLLYQVRADDSLSTIAEAFKAKVEDITQSPVNQWKPEANLIPGMELFVPKGVKPIIHNTAQIADVQPYTVNSSRQTKQIAIAPQAPLGMSGAFIWPTQGSITQGFFWGHGGLDIAYAMGVPVLASDGGVVRYAGWDNTGYGWLVVVDHGNGFTTLYAHLDSFPVEVGQSVARGQLIGLMGSSGRSTGPHTHFEIRYNGVAQNPLFYLP
jgi:murein DD-endopeptidase MepM/ murein hydrolase activator NlpD